MINYRAQTSRIWNASCKVESPPTDACTLTYVRTYVRTQIHFLLLLFLHPTFFHFDRFPIFVVHVRTTLRKYTEATCSSRPVELFILKRCLSIQILCTRLTFQVCEERVLNKNMDDPVFAVHITHDNRITKELTTFYRNNKCQ